MSKRERGRFEQATQRSSVLDRITSANIDPLRYYYNKLEVGESVVFRIIDMADVHAEKEEDRGFSLFQNMKLAAIKTNDGIKYFPVALPDDPDEQQNILDDEGVALADLKDKNAWRLPVWMLCKLDKKGRIEENFGEEGIGEVKYMDWGPGLQQDFKKMELNEEDGDAFTGLPHYSLKLTIVEGTKKGVNNYELKHFKNYLDDAGKKRIADEMDGESSLKVALGEEAWQIIVDSIDDLTEHLIDEAAKEAKPENVKRRFARYRQGVDGGKDDSKAGKPAGMKDKPQLPRRKAEDTPDPTPDDEPGADAAEENQEEGSGRFNKLRGKFKK